MNATKLFLSVAMTFSVAQMIQAQPTPEHKPDVSNKALITKATPSMSAQTSTGAAALRKLADDYYTWRNENYPVRSSDSGLHTWDDRLTDYSPAKVAARAQRVQIARASAQHARREMAEGRSDRLAALPFAARSRRLRQPRDEVRAERPADLHRRMREWNFSLLKKEYDTPEKRALAATARLKQMPAMLAQGTSNLKTPVKLYAQLAIASARSIDSLFQRQLDDPCDRAFGRATRRAGESARRRARCHSRLRRSTGEAAPGNGRLQADGRGELQLLLEARAPSPARCHAGGNARPRGTRSLSRARSAPARSLTGRSRSRAQREYSAGPGRVSKSIRKPRGGDDRLSPRAQADHAARLPRTIPNPSVARRVQADQSRRLHESARPLR